MLSSERYRTHPYSEGLGWIVQERVGRYDWRAVRPAQVHPSEDTAAAWIEAKLAALWRAAIDRLPWEQIGRGARPKI